MSGPLDRPAVRVAFGAGTEDLRKVGPMLELDPTPAGAAAIAGELGVAPGTVALSSLNGAIGAAALSGRSRPRYGGPRPKLAGRLAVSELDLRACLTNAPAAAPEVETETLAKAFGELERTDLGLGRLTRIDADVQLSVAHWAGPPGDVRDVSDPPAHRRRQARCAARGDHCRCAVRRRAGCRRRERRRRIFAPSFSTREAPLGGLAELVFDAPYVAGTRAPLRGDARRPRRHVAAQLVGDLDGRIRIEGAGLTYGNFAGGRSVAMRLDAAEVSQPRGRTIAGKVSGSLRGKSFERDVPRRHRRAHLARTAHAVRFRRHERRACVHGCRARSPSRTRARAPQSHST